MILNELQDSAPVYDWRAHCDDAFRAVNRKFSERERVIVSALDYSEKLTELVKEYNATDNGKM